MTDANYIRSYGKPVMMGHNLYFGSTSYYINTSGGAVLSSVSAASATLTNAKVTGDLYVDGVLTSNEYVKNIVKAVGGQLYISPTFVATPSQTTIQCTSTDSTYLYLTISDNTAITALAYAGANWYKDSKIMFSGTLQGNKSGAPEVVFASNTGEVTANMNSTSGKLQIKVAYSSAGTYFQAGAVTFSDVTVMMYRINIPSGSTNAGEHPIGIYIKSYGNDNKNAYIDIFGGTTNTPNARLGLLDGLSALSNGTSPTGWGIATTNGYFNGTIVSSSGTIGSFTIGQQLSSGTWGDANGSIFLSVGYNPGANNKSIGGSANNLTNWVITAADKFGVTKDGKLYATRGKIGSWEIGDSSIYKGTNSLGAANSAYFGTDGLSIGTKFKVDSSGVVTLGEASGYHATMDADSFDVLYGTNDSSIATFGAVTRIGIGASTIFNDNSLSFTNGDGDEIMLVSGDGIIIGKAGNASFSVGSQSITLKDSDGDDVFTVTSGDEVIYTQSDYHTYKENFTNGQVNDGVTVNVIQNKNFIVGNPTNVRVEFCKYYEREYVVDGQTVTVPYYYVYTTKNLASQYYTSTHTDYTSGKIVLTSGSSGGVKKIKDWVSQY